MHENLELENNLHINTNNKMPLCIPFKQSLFFCIVETISRFKECETLSFVLRKVGFKLVTAITQLY